MGTAHALSHTDTLNPVQIRAGARRVALCVLCIGVGDFMIMRHEDSSSPHLWIGAGLIGLFIAVISFLSPQVRNERTPMGQEDVSYSYEMARIEPEDGPFDLSDREVQRRKRELEALAQKKITAAPIGASAGTGKTAAAAAKKAPVKPLSIKNAAGAANRMAVDTISDSDRFRMRSGLSGDSGSGSNRQAQPNYYAATPAPQAAAPKPEKEEEEAKLSPAQWRSLLQTSPSIANVNKLVAARVKGDIDDNVILEIARDLLRDSGDARQKAGLLILDRAPSSQIFVFMVRDKAEFSANIQTEFQKRVESYSQPIRLMYLGPVLASSGEDKAAATVAMQLIEVAVSEYRRRASGQISQNNRNSAPSLAQLQVFVSTLRRVGQSGDTALAPQAVALTTAIQDLKPITSQPGTTARLTQTARLD